MEGDDDGQWLAGHFLIAETDLQDPNFFRTVVVMVHHNSEGAFGIVVNRRSEVTVGEVIDEAVDCGLAELPVYVGGPVQQNYVFTFHGGVPDRYRSDHCEEVCPGLYFEPSLRHLIEYSKSEDYLTLDVDERPPIRVYAGYSGWGTGQLEDEIEENAWFVHPAHPDVVFKAEPGEGWKEALSKKGSFYRIVAETGYNPSLN